MYSDYLNTVDQEIQRHNRQLNSNRWMLRCAIFMCLMVISLCAWAAVKLF